MKNLEKNIKDSLEQRRIEPSENAWKAIQKEMETSKKKNFFNYWPAVAAVIVIGGLVFFLFNFNQAKNDVIPINKHNYSKENKVMPQVETEHRNETEKVKIEEELITPNTQYVTPKKPTIKSTDKKTAAPQKLIFKETYSEPEIRLVENVEITNDTTPKVTIKKEQKLEKLMVNNTEKQVSEEKTVKVNAEKLLFYVENEKEIKKPKNKVAFEDNALSFDLSDN